MQALYERTVGEDVPVELVVTPECRESLEASSPRKLAAMCGVGNAELLVGEVPAYGLVLAGADGETTLYVLAPGESNVHGVIENDRRAAVRWAERRYGEVRAEATEVTSEIADATGTAPTDERTEGGSPVSSRPVPAVEREGFVELSAAFFADRPVAEPATAWRAGLDLAEVHVGYAAERTGEAGTALTDRLTETLAAGGDCVLVGPPAL